MDVVVKAPATPNTSVATGIIMPLIKLVFIIKEFMVVIYSIAGFRSYPDTGQYIVGSYLPLFSILFKALRLFLKP